jgi:hypothetical protein
MTLRPDGRLLGTARFVAFQIPGLWLSFPCHPFDGAEVRMVEVSILGDEVLFRVMSWYKRWSIPHLREVRVHRRHIRDARHERPASPIGKGWRNLGCWIPSVVTFGSYKVRNERHYYDVMDWGKVVVVDLQNEHFDRVAVQVEDPAAVVQLLLKDRG